MYLSRYESLRQQEYEELPVALPKGSSRKDISDDVSLYGFRGTHADMFFLSPWEFWQWFFEERLLPPRRGYPYTVLTETGKTKMDIPFNKRPSLDPGIDYVLNEKWVQSATWLYPFPKRHIDEEPASPLCLLRHTWILVKRMRPVVPSPQMCPMPNRRTPAKN